MQPEEQARNSVMYDLLYVHREHTLSPQIYAYYQSFHRLPPSESVAVALDLRLRFGNWLNSNDATHLTLLMWICDYFLRVYH